MLYGTSRRTRSILARAAAGALYHNSDADKQGGASVVQDKKDDAPADKGKKKDDASAEPKKVQLTEDELAERIESAKKTVKDEIAAKQKEADEKRQREDDEAKGNFKKLADEEKAKREEVEREREAMKLDAKRRDVKDAVSDYVVENHPDYVKCVRYILSQVEFDQTTAPEDITKRVKVAADQYVKDNPRSKLPPVPGGARKLGSDAPPPKDDPNKANGNNVYAKPSRRF